MSSHRPPAQNRRASGPPSSRPAHSPDTANDGFSSDFTHRFERLELKYLVDEITTADIRRQIAPYCLPDKHSSQAATDRPGMKGYPIRSLYLDTPSLAFHNAKERGDPDRIKLRIRTYSDTSPAILEIKRRRRDVIDKTRGIVDRDRVKEVAHGMVVDPEQGRFLSEFSGLIATAGAEPKLSVKYEREAYVSQVDDYARVTFDRHIEVQSATNWDLSPENESWCSFNEYWQTDHFTLPVVMEIKCRTSSLPHWVIDMVRENALAQTSFSKYSIGIHLTHRHDGQRANRSRSARALG